MTSSVAWIDRLPFPLVPNVQSSLRSTDISPPHPHRYLRVEIPIQRFVTISLQKLEALPYLSFEMVRIGGMNGVSATASSRLPGTNATDCGM